MQVSPLFERIAIIGLGLIGSSIARVALARGLGRHIVAADLGGDVLITQKGLLGIRIMAHRERYGTRGGDGPRILEIDSGAQYGQGDDPVHRTGVEIPGTESACQTS